MVAAAALFPSRKNIIQDAVHYKDSNHVVAAVKAAAWFEILEGKGARSNGVSPAPTNTAFGKAARPAPSHAGEAPRPRPTLDKQILNLSMFVPGKLESFRPQPDGSKGKLKTAEGRRADRQAGEDGKG